MPSPAASSASAMEVPISTNSSPPKRATVSAVRTTVASRRATSCSNSSPGAVAQGIVDQLESVQIAYQDRERAHVAVGVRDRLLQSIVQQDAIGQTRQCIMGGQMPQLLVRRLQSPRAGR